MTENEPQKTPHPALVITALSTALIAVSAVLWLLAAIEFQVIVP